jgi:hypothetical protein
MDPVVPVEPAAPAPPDVSPAAPVVDGAVELVVELVSVAAVESAPGVLLAFFEQPATIRLVAAKAAPAASRAAREDLDIMKQVSLSDRRGPKGGRSHSGKLQEPSSVPKM